MLSVRRQAGLSIVELMVGMAVGLVVMGGVISIYISTLKTSSETLQSSRLNQEMSAIMNIMINDIRRAGYWGSADLTSPEGNPFNQVDTGTPTNTTAVRVHSTDDNGTTYTDKSDEAVMADRVGSCIVYTYDAGGTVGTLDDAEKFGFRWDGEDDDALMMRRSSNAGSNICQGGTGTWNAVTDTDFIEITNLQFSLAGSKCMNASEPDGVDEDGGGVVDEFDEYNCYLAAYAPDAGERTVENLAVEITLSARLVDAPEVRATITQSVQVRNYVVRIR